MPSVRIALVSELARAAGLGGMAGGQMLDLAAEGRFEDKHARSAENDVVTLQAMKTGALIRFACRAGAILGQADATRARRRSTAMARRSARRSRSPTTCSTSKATPKPSARPPARTPPPARPRWSTCSASPAPAPGSRALVARGRRRAGAVRRESRYSARRRALHRRAKDLRRSNRWPARLPLGR